MIDYAVIKLIWWILVGVLMVGFAIMDGHDMGVGTLLPFLGKTDNERRIMLNSVGPHWEGNQVWFLTAGGALFAAWPDVYATAFSGFYMAMLCLLWSLFLRPVGFDYRSKMPNPGWRNTWDWCLFVGSFVSPLVIGVAFGNLLLGVPFQFDDMMRVDYTGHFYQLLNPFALLCGMVSLMMMTFHGANFLLIKSEGALQQRARTASIVTGVLMMVLFALGGVWVSHLPGYVVQAGLDPSAIPNVLAKTVLSGQVGAWLNNYNTYPAMLALPVIAFAGGILGVICACVHRPILAFIGSSLAQLGVIGTAGVSLFPFVMPSSSHPASSLTLWDATSSQWTLNLMFWAVLIFIPIVIAYTAWCYRVMRGKVTEAHIEANDKSTY